MKLEFNYWRTICFISIAISSLCLLNVVVAQDQNPPYGMDKGVWVLKDVKPDFETQEDTDSYYNNKVDISETSVKGGLSWRDPDCSGTEWGTSSWEELPAALEPGVRQNTTLNAEVGGSQSCSGRHVNAYTKLAVDDRDLTPIADVSFDSSDPKPAPVSVRIPWEAPWGKMGDTLIVTIVANVPGAAALHHYLNYVYTYQAEAPSTAPNTSETFPKMEIGGKSETKEMAKEIEEPCPGECVDSGARFSSISREVEVYHCWDEDSRSFANSRTVLCVGDHIVTGEYSNAVVTCSDASSFMVKPESDIAIIAPHVKATKLEIIYGHLKANVQRVLSGDPLEIRSNLATVGIKGTTIVCEVTESSSTLKVLEGTASFTAKATGEEILVSAGEMATATESGLLQLQSFDIDVENASWEELASEPEGFVKDIYTSGRGEESKGSKQDGYKLLVKGNEYFDNGSMDEANECWENANKAFDDAIDIDPLNASYWNGKGSALLNMEGFEKLEEAVWAFDKAVQLDPQNAMYWNHKGLALMRIGECDEAIKAYDKAIELDPDKAFIYWNNKGSALAQSGRYDDSVEASRKSMSYGLDLDEMIHLYGSEMLMGKLS